MIRSNHDRHATGVRALLRRPALACTPARLTVLGPGLALGLVLTLAAPGPAVATEGGTAAELFHGADLKLGEKLIAEHDCDSCHARSFGHDGRDIYRPKGRINTPAALKAQVEYCSSQLNLMLFPEDTLAIGAVLQRDHYRFK